MELEERETKERAITIEDEESERPSSVHVDHLNQSSQSYTFRGSQEHHLPSIRNIGTNKEVLPIIDHAIPTRELSSLPKTTEEQPDKVKKKKKKRKHVRMKEDEGEEENFGYNYENLKELNDEVISSGRSSGQKLIRIDEDIHEREPSPEEGKKDIRREAIELALKGKDNGVREKAWHYDYVLVHKTGDNNNSHERLRAIFEKKLSKEAFKIEKKYTIEYTFTVFHCPFERLCVEAENVVLEMPLAGYEVPEAPSRGFLRRLLDKFKTDTEVDFVSAPFCVSKKSIYEGIDNPDTFFRPALRSLLVDHILKSIDIRDKETRVLGQNRQGLRYLLLEGAYKDAFILHEKSSLDPKFPLPDLGDDGTYLWGQDISDPRKFLDNTWLKVFKFQPLWKVKNYFGEQIALYFAWLGSLTFSLIIPMLLGLAIFLWGLIVAVNESPLRTPNATASTIINKWAKKAFDNNATPYFALIICLWGTIFLELWKRTTARLAYQWDVDMYEEQEPNRPQFYGTKIKPDPVTGEEEPFYPFARRVWKMSGSFGILLLMVCLVLASLVGVIIYRIIARVDFFAKEGLLGPTLASLTSTFLNTCSIMFMGKVYQVLANKLTDWENHRTQTSYDDALIIKLFGFQFVNSYTSLFYIAFFRQQTAKDGILDLGAEYNDSCGPSNDCMTLLSLQVAMLMIMKPLPKTITDIILPWLKRMWRQGCCCCRSNKVEEAGEVNSEIEDFLTYEMQKEPLGDFTLSEYTEKVLQYGFLMLFAAAFPLAPLIALLSNLIDMKIDARRLLWVNRRPIAYRAEDIGMWFGILEFLNIVGVVTNGFLVTFTSDYGKNWEEYSNVSTSNTTLDPTTNTTIIMTKEITLSRLWLLIGFEHIVFTIKYLIQWLIPDVPADVRLAQRREKHHVANILSRAGVRKGPGKKLTQSTGTYRRLTSREDNTKDEPVVQNSAGVPVSPGAPETNPRRDRQPGVGVLLDPLPTSYTSKVKNDMVHKLV